MEDDVLRRDVDVPDQLRRVRRSRRDARRLRGLRARQRARGKANEAAASS
jgi:hypothetical protein